MSKKIIYQGGRAVGKTQHFLNNFRDEWMKSIEDLSDDVYYDDDMRDEGYYRLSVNYEEENQKDDFDKKLQLIKIAKSSFTFLTEITAIKVNEETGTVIFKKIDLNRSKSKGKAPEFEPPASFYNQ